MTDIVERLRGEDYFGVTGRDVQDAADEIERLRSELNMAVVAKREAEDKADEMFAGCQTRNAKIERLMQELADREKDIACDEQRVADLMSDVQRLGAEIERLRTRYEDQGSTHYDGCWDTGSRHYECALREIERLRGLLRDTLDMYKGGPWADAYWIKRVREALGE